MTDGSLPASKARLDKAIDAVFNPIRERINGCNRVAPSLYAQLEESIPGITGERAGGQVTMPLWVDAADLRNTIVTQIAEWWPKGFNILDRLQSIENHPYRPQDCELIDRMAAVMEAWPHAIKTLLYPERHWSLPAKCPNCDTATIYRKDSSGEFVRQAALQIDSQGCQCQKCRTRWSPELFMHLARTLGYNPDTSVLE